MFIFWLICHLTPILLIAPKQCWCYFEAFECIFHLSLKFFRSFHELTHNQQNRAFPNLWSTLYLQKKITYISIRASVWIWAWHNLSGIFTFFDVLQVTIFSSDNTIFTFKTEKKKKSNLKFLRYFVYCLMGLGPNPQKILIIAESRFGYLKVCSFIV